MAMEGSLSPLSSSGQDRRLCAVLSSMACFVCKMTKKPASLTNFPQHSDCTAEFVHQFRPARSVAFLSFNANET